MSTTERRLQDTLVGAAWVSWGRVSGNDILTENCSNSDFVQTIHSENTGLFLVPTPRWLCLQFLLMPLWEANTEKCRLSMEFFANMKVKDYTWIPLTSVVWIPYYSVGLGFWGGRGWGMGQQHCPSRENTPAAVCNPHSGSQFLYLESRCWCLFPQWSFHRSWGLCLPIKSPDVS